MFREIEAMPKAGRRWLCTASLRRRVVPFVEKRIAAGGSESNGKLELRL